jgi:hypothetical protein
VYPAIAVLALAGCTLAGRWLGPRDRVLIYVVLAVGLPVSASGLVLRFLPALVTGSYGGFTNPNGRYYEIARHIPRWMVPGEPGSSAAAAAFEGGAPVPWSSWVLPLGFWALFFAAIFLVSLSLAFILRKRWIETERLGFPLLILPLELIQCQEGGRPILKHRGFWAGVLIPGVVFGINGLHHYYPAVGEVGTTLNLGDFLLDYPWKAMAPFTSQFQFEFSPMLTGIAYLMPVEVSFSTWFFFLLSRFQLLVVHILGLSDSHGSFPGLGAQWGDWPNTVPFFMCQARGGLLLIGLYGLWSARGAWRDAASVRNVPFVGLIAGAATAWALLGLMGLGAFTGIAVLILFFLFAAAFLRLRADGGLPVTGSPVIIGYLFYLVFGTGPGRFDPQTYVSFAFLAVLSYTAVGAWPVLQLEALKLCESHGIGGKTAARYLVFALILGLGAGCYFALATFYDWSRIAFHALGAGLALALLWLRRRFLRWPLHPIGYIYGTGFGWLIWGAALTGWAAKWLVSRYGGARTYRTVRPVFLGMVFGEIAMRGLWGLVSVVHGEMGSGYPM